MPPLLMKLVFDRIETQRRCRSSSSRSRARSRAVQDAFIDPHLKLHLDFMEARARQARWFAGDEFTAADIQMSFPIEAAAARGGLDAAGPKLDAFLERIHARPAYRRALEAAAPTS